MTVDISLHEVCVRVGVRYVITKFSQMDSLPNFLTHGAPQARASRGRELRYECNCLIVSGAQGCRCSGIDYEKKKSQKIALLPLTSKFGQQEVNSFCQLCAQFQPPASFELHATIFQKCRKMAVRSERYLGCFCIE